MEQLPSAEDETSPLSLKQLAKAIDSLPIQSLKPSTRKGNLHLVHFHQNAADSCISRLPNNLIRLLISYNTVRELLAFSCTSKRFSQFLFDKYIAFSGDCGTDGFFKEDRFTFQEHFDLLRRIELSTHGYKVKIHASLRPDFTSLFHINTKKETCFSYAKGEIIEGELVRYNDSMQIKATRPCIAQACVWDVCGEVIVCASSAELALSLPSQPLRTTRFQLEEVPGAVRLLDEKRLIVIERGRKLETWSELLQPLGEIRHEGGIHTLQVADLKQMVFTTQSTVGFVTVYRVNFQGNIEKMWQWASDFGQSNVKSSHLASINGEFVLIILTIGGTLYANRSQITKSKEIWTHFSVLKDKLFVGSADSVFLFTYNSRLGQYRSISKLRVGCDPWSLRFDYIYYSRMKGIAVFETESGHKVVYFSPSPKAISTFYTVNLPRISDLTVQIYKEVVVLKGNLVVEKEGTKWPVPCVYVLNYNLNSMLTRDPDLTQEARDWVEEKNAEIAKLRLKRAEMKRKEKSEKAKKAEEREKKHRPKH